MNATLTVRGPRLHRDANREPRFDGIGRVLRPVEHGREIGIARRCFTTCMRSPSMAVFDLLGVVEAPAGLPKFCVLKPDLQVVLAVEWKEMLNGHAADGAKRQPLDVLVLRQILAKAIGLARGATP